MTLGLPGRLPVVGGFARSRLIRRGVLQGSSGALAFIP